MTLEQLDKIAGWAYGFGFLYALLIGQLLIPRVTNLMYDLVESVQERKSAKKHCWQPVIIGLIERTLYTISLLGGYGGFILGWTALKVGVPYIRWTGSRNENDDPWGGRVLFMNALYGNALSILYSVVGYLIILCLSKEDIKRAVYVASVLIIFNAFLWLRLSIYKKKVSNCSTIVKS